MREQGKRVVWVSWTLVVSLLIGCATSGDQKAPGTGPGGAFDYANRMQIYAKMDERAEQLLKSPGKPKIIDIKKVSGQGPISNFALFDKNLDGTADAFAYQHQGEGTTDDFGFVFDLNQDGKMDYFVFNGGSMLTEDMTRVWMTYHGIDSNADGATDILVFKVDRNGNGLVDPGVLAWLYDRDFDGALDDGEYLGKDFQQPVEKSPSELIVKTAAGEKKYSTRDKLLISPNELLKEINSMKTSRT